MKKVSAELLKHLNTTKDFIALDLYEICLHNGTALRCAGGGRDITLPDGRVFMANGPVFERSGIKVSAGSVVDTLDVEVYADGSDKIGGVPFMDLAHNGGLDDAALSLSRCYFTPEGNIAGLLPLFSGEIDSPEGGGLSLKLKVKSPASRLNADYPIRSYLTGCPFSLYDISCGVNLAAFTKTGTVVSGSLSSMRGSFNFTAGYYDQGGVEFTSGALNGLAAPVKYSANDGFSFLVPLPAAPQTWDTFRAYPGCDKRPDTCRNKFSNWPRNRATPYVPLPEAIL